MSTASTSTAERVLCALAGAVAATLYWRCWARRGEGSAPGEEANPKAVTIDGITVPPESTIRLMTRIALKHGAANLSQGFPNEPPPRAIRLAAAGALLAGATAESAQALADRLAELVPEEAEEKDSLNQYSFPFGTPILRTAISQYFGEFYPEVQANAEDNLTVVLGATEGFAVCLRALCRPGDSVVFFQPFHELYPAQCTLWGLRPRAVTLYERGSGWEYDEAELDAALAGAKVLLFNSPHNPTGKVFSRDELGRVAAACERHGVVAVTDEIYEHICFDGTRHISLAQLPGMADRTCIVSAVSKTARATGWRVGWVVSPSRLTPAIRAVHDQLVLQAPTPLQYGAAALLRLGRPYFDGVAAEYLAKRTLLVDALVKARFTVGVIPQGAYYVFAGYGSVPALASLSPIEAAMKLTRDFKVACVPGDNFYLGQEARADPERGGRYVRFTFVRSVDVLAQAAANLAQMPG